MRLDELPRATIHATLKRLSGTFGKKGDMDPDTWVAEVQRATHGWTADELETAVGAAVNECRFFPRVADLLSRRPIKFGAHREEPSGGGDTCSSCGAHYFYAGFELPNGEAHGRLRCDCHLPSTRWFTPAARAWRLSPAVPSEVVLLTSPWVRAEPTP